ncbi:MAG: flagellar biosynthesis protein FlgA, partial [Geminicoccaceae bacterium]
GLTVDPSGRVAALYRPIHMIGLELGISVASAALRGEPTGCPRGFRADVIATAKRDLEVGEVLDGEGGETVWGSLVPAQTSIAEEGLPIGLAHGVAMTRRVAAGSRLSLRDVALDPNDQAFRMRQGMLGADGPSRSLSGGARSGRP